MMLERNDTADIVAKDLRKCSTFSASVQIFIHISLVLCPLHLFIGYVQWIADC